MTNSMVLAQELLACLEAQLTVGPYAIPASKVMMRAGSEVTPLLGTGTDECCTGLGWVRIQTLSGVKELGDIDNVSGCFAQERRLVLEMGVARCAPSSDISTVPTEDQWMDAALKLDADMGSMEAAVCCAFGDLTGSPAQEVAVGSYQPFGVDGNCIGGTMTVSLALDACCPTGG
jgi:hypothetical protein